MPVKGSKKEKQTNEIKTAIPLLDSIDIQGKTITADALLTQCDLAKYIVVKRKAHYHFTAKDNQKKLLKEVAAFFKYVSWDPDPIQPRVNPTMAVKRPEKSGSPLNLINT